MTKQNRLVLLATSALGFILLPATAGAGILLDDFEAGNFHYVQTGNTSTTNPVPVNEPPHCLTGVREVRIQTFSGGTVDAFLTTGTQSDDAVTMDFFGTGGVVAFRYTPAAPVDLTAGALRFHIDVRQVIPGVTMSLKVWDGSSSTVISKTVTSTGSVSFPIPTNDPVFESAVYIEVAVDATGDEGRCVLGDFRFKRDSGYYAQFLGDFTATQTPPVPTSPLTWWARDDFGQNLFRGAMTAVNVDNNGYVPESSWNWSETPFQDGEMAFVKCWWPLNEYLDSPTFSLAFDFQPAGGLTPEIIFPPDPVHGTRSLGVCLGLLLRDAGGTPVGTSEIDIVFAAGRYQEVEFADVVLTPGSAASSAPGGAATGFEITFRLDGYNFEYQEPLFDISFISDWSTSSTSAVGIQNGGRTAGLIAVPSVMRSGTVLHANAPMVETAGIGIFDIHGRLVRRLALSSGDTSIAWDGRDTHGVPLAAGVYWARLTGSNSATARIVKVR